MKNYGYILFVFVLVSIGCQNIEPHREKNEKQLSNIDKLQAFLGLWQDVDTNVFRTIPTLYIERIDTFVFENYKVLNNKTIKGKMCGKIYKSQGKYEQMELILSQSNDSLFWYELYANDYDETAEIGSEGVIYLIGDTLHFSMIPEFKFIKMQDQDLFINSFENVNTIANRKVIKDWNHEKPR